MADTPKAAGFDSDPSLRHRTLFNRVLWEDFGEDGVQWCADFGEFHAIDDPRDLCLSPEAAKRCGAENPFTILDAPKLLKLIADGQARLEARRQQALGKALTSATKVVSEVDTGVLTDVEREVIRRLLEARPLLTALDIALKDDRGPAFAAYLASSGDTLGQRMFAKAAADMCPNSLAPEDFAFCSALDFFPNERPVGESDFPTMLAPEDITTPEIKAFTKLVPGDPMWNPFLMGGTIVARDPQAPGGFRWTNVTRDPRYQGMIGELSAAIVHAAQTPGIDPSLASQLLMTAGALLSDSPFAGYSDEAGWLYQRSGNIEVGVGLAGGYSPMGKVRGAALSIGVVRQGEAAFLEKELFPRLQEAEKKLARLIGGDYPARTLAGNVPVRIVDMLHEVESKFYTTLAFIGPGSGPYSSAGLVKSVIIANHHEAKFDHILKPLAALALVPEQAALVGREQFVMESAAHESSHSIGPREDTKVGDTKIKSIITDDLYEKLEESKANTGGIVVLELVHKAGHPKINDEYMKKLYVTYVAGLLRQMRFGSKSHGGGAWSEMNFLIAQGAVKAVTVAVGGKPQTRLEVDLAKIPGVVEAMWVKIAGIQARANRTAADIHVNELKAIPDAMEGEILKRINDAGIPVDVEMVYQEKAK